MVNSERGNSNLLILSCLPFTIYRSRGCLQKLIEQTIHLTRLVQLNPVAGAGYHAMRETMAQPVQTERLVVMRRDYRKPGTLVSGQRGIGIELHDAPKHRHDCLPRCGPEIGQQTVLDVGVGAGYVSPVCLAHAVV